MRRIEVSTAVVAFALFVCAPAFAQRGGGSRSAKDKVAAWRGDAIVNGKVTDDTGKAIDQAKVTWIFIQANDGFFATTKKSGEYNANDIKAGQWRVQVEAPNFVTLRQEVNVENKKNTLNFSLKRDFAPELLTKADALFKAGDNSGARTEYLKVLADHPELTAINRAIAFTYGREHNNLEAIKYLEIALQGNPNDPQLLQLATATSIELSDYPRAMGYLGKIDDAALTDPEVLNASAISLLNKQRSTEAIAVLNRVIGRFPDAPDAYFYRAYGLLQQQKTADAKPDLEKYLQLAPNGGQSAKAKELLANIK
ncbi:MAG TPA: tetratricopeptide repeat protein [Vicinamibacterales bacterium]|nr:tetratricopeptide repeat protein [Vicinamibacterales bacterium]